MVVPPQADVSYGSDSDFRGRPSHFRSSLNSGHKAELREVRYGPQGDIGLAYSITSSAVARSEGEIVTLFQKRVHSMSPATGGAYQTFGGALDGRIPPGLRVVTTSHPLDQSGDF